MKNHKYILYTFLLIFGLFANDLFAQRMRHTNRGSRQMNTNRSMSNRSINGGFNKSTTRPKTQNYTPTKRTSNNNRNTKNRERNKATTGNRNTEKRNTNNASTRDRNNVSDNRNTNRETNRNRDVNRDRTVNRNVEINSHHYNTYYNGHRGYHAYHYHGYRGFHYGVHWHPIGYTLAVMATTAVIISWMNQPYYYNQGVYYTEVNNTYTVVNPPTNIVVNTLPEGVEKVTLNDVEYYYYGGAFYEKTTDSYRVIDAPDGAVITNIPEGATEEEIDGVNYVVYNHTYFQPFAQNGVDLYQVVEMESK